MEITTTVKQTTDGGFAINNVVIAVNGQERYRTTYHNAEDAATARTAIAQMLSVLQEEAYLGKPLFDRWGVLYQPTHEPQQCASCQQTTEHFYQCQYCGQEVCVSCFSTDPTSFYFEMCATCKQLVDQGYRTIYADFATHLRDALPDTLRQQLQRSFAYVAQTDDWKKDALALHRAVQNALITELAKRLQGGT